MLARGAKDKEHAMSEKLYTAIAVIGIDIGKNSFHIVGLDQRGAIVLRQKWATAEGGLGSFTSPSPGPAGTCPSGAPRNPTLIQRTGL
jgi:hypothetical protein